MKKIAVLADFLRPHHCAQITETAHRCGFEADFYPDGKLPAEKAADYQIVYAPPFPEMVKAAPNVEWFCSCYAGVDAITDDALYPSPDTLLSNSAGSYGLTISEHLVMVILMLLRHMPEVTENMRLHRWEYVKSMRSIYASRITVLGTGDIGTNFARRARAMGAAHICGVRRSQGAADPAFDETRTLAELNAVLPTTDILVMALPSTPETIGVLSRERIALLPPEAIVVNVGRGTAVDQEALIDALNEERIAGAALDVVIPEPVPEGHPLWSAKNLLLTPHIAGQNALPRTADINIGLFCEDLENYASGRPLRHLVDRRLGY